MVKEIPCIRCLEHTEVLEAELSHEQLGASSGLHSISGNAMCVSRYGGEHRAPELQKEAVYGLTELHREEVKKARLVANPGCYPTSVQLPLCPLLEVGCIHSLLSVIHVSCAKLMNASWRMTQGWCYVLPPAEFHVG